MPKKPTKLKYIGKNGDYYQSFPTTDYEADSAEQAKELVATGLYEEVAERSHKDDDDKD